MSKINIFTVLMPSNAKIKELFFKCNVFKPAKNILIADCVSVPEHNSSPKIKLFSLEQFNIVLNSDISTAKVLKPLNISSLPKILVKILFQVN